MPRPKKAMPDYRYHVSGQAFVTLGGKDFYLGNHGSPESHAKYLSLVGESQANGLKAPEVDPQQGNKSLTVTGLMADFIANGLKRISTAENHRQTFRNLATLVTDEYGDEPVEHFGPRKLEEVRDLFVASGNRRLMGASKSA
ncbi:hypothetical protein [Roseiconus lacunae]|uniref:hypothetical protein n=1 Tax=Roseiconus lacunae TaxID=2605694 RepID=UPI0011F1587F|nr:hypothetical protein [Roseiconus lacunae]